MPALDDQHDLGLLHDLAVLRARPASPPPLERRGALKVLGGAGLGLLLAACGSDGAAIGTTSTSTSTSTTGGATATTAAGAGTPTDAIPTETAGPFPADGSNGPDVLTESGVVRDDLRNSFGAYSGIADGVPLRVELTVVDAASGTPLPAAALYLWHCDRAGAYSLYSAGVTDQNYLRGVQEAGEDGRLAFTTVFPGAYPGRWPHLHFEVFSGLADATRAGSRLVTSQLALPPEACQAVYGTSGYESSAATIDGTSPETDNVFRDGYQLQLAEVSGDVGAGLSASLVVGV